MAKKKRRSKSKANTNTPAPAANETAKAKKGVEFHGVTPEAYQKEMERRREADAKVHPASFPVVSREDSSIKGNPDAQGNPYGIAGWQGEKPHFFPADSYDKHEPAPEEFKPLSDKPKKKSGKTETIPESAGPRKRGRPPVAMKKKQYTLTMRPDMYEKATAVAQERGISFSALVAMAMGEYIGD